MRPESETAMENERDIILKWKKGEKGAFEHLVRRYMTEAYFAALGFVGNREDARDLSQDAFVKAFEAKDRFDADKPFFPWFYRILKNHCLNFLKRRVKGHESLYFEDQPGKERYKSSTPSPLEKLETAERHRILRAAIDRLSVEHKEVIVLKNFKGYSYADIAELLDIPIGTVMSRLYYARKLLKEMILELEMRGIPDSTNAWVEDHPATGEVV
jgi:RNA polymerase sigma-70 factor (ECF subfamily)